MEYELKHNHPGMFVYSQVHSNCDGCRSRAVAMNAVQKALLDTMGHLPLSVRDRAAWEAVVKVESHLMYTQRFGSQIVPSVTGRTHPTIPPWQGVPSDQGRNQTPLQPPEFQGEGRRSPECFYEIHPACTLPECGCKCHAIRAAYSG